MTKNIPAAIEIEAALLGSVIINPELRDQLDLGPDDFYIHRNRAVWTAMGNLNGSLDFVTLADELDRMGELQTVGGPAYLAHLVAGVPTSLHAAEYADRLRDLSRRRALLTAANQIAQLAFDLDSPTDEAYHLIEQVQAGAGVSGGAAPILDWVGQAYDELSARHHQDHELFALKTGFADLDRFIGGLYPDEGTLFLLAGQPGIGKTILLKDICEHLAAQAPGALYSLEMKRLRLMIRSLSARTGLSAWDMRQGKLSDGEFEQVAGAISEYDRIQLYVSDRSDWTTAALRADLYRLKHQHGIKWWALDYLSLIDDAIPGLKDYERVREVSRRILQINRGLGLASIVIHTLNKEGFERHAGMSAFSGSAGVMYDADLSAYLSDGGNPDVRTDGAWVPVDLNFVKNRDGEDGLGKIQLGRLKKRPQFITPTRDDHGEEPVAWWQK